MSSTPIKDGKRPISQKAQPQTFFEDAGFGTALTIPPDIQAELDAQGLTGRWLNAKKLHENQGYHPKGWKVYHHKSKGTASDTISTSSKYGNDPDGIIRRGDCILGVKSKDALAYHKKFLEDKANHYHRNVNSQKAQEMRSHLGRAGFKNAQVLEGYEDNE
jgi:hypothetical protein